MSALTLETVVKRYGEVDAVRGVSLDVASGEFVVLVGPSGCGKSTLLRAIAGLEDIDGGDIRFEGRSVAALPPKARNVAMVFQSYALYPYLSVYENVAFGLRARKVAEAEVRRKVAWAAELLGLGDYLQRRPRELSGGQRQRVAIGRAIVRDASVYLFDEPLSNLDAKLRDGMREELKRLHAELGRTFVYVTHDQVEAMTLAMRIVLLRDGEVAQAGAPLDLFERPRSRFVAGFLGSPAMSFIPAQVTDSGGGLALPDGQVMAMTDAQRALGLAAGSEVVWGVRPEHFLVGDADAPLAATVTVLQPTGSRSFASFALGDSHAVAELDAHRAPRAGETLRLDVLMARTSLFDPRSGASLGADG